ncbi:CPBP family intramembrane metalloprotease [Candidatus Peregrinibacteria bacterium]|nr:CPBP family intramembrane metalloprotease [Candidatus Peregrinibacteria bacterium]
MNFFSPSTDAARVPWTMRDLIKVLLLILALVAFFFFLRDFFADSLFFRKIEIFQFQSLVTFLLFMLQNVIFLFPLYFFTLRKYGSKFRDFGFRKIGIFRCFGLALKYYLLFFVVMMVIFTLLPLFGIDHLPGFDQQEPHLPLFGDDSLSVFLATLVVIILAPVVEEFFFRGYLLQILLKKMSIPVASIVSAFIFSFVHFEFSSFIPIFILSLILNRLFIRSRNIWPGICFHFFNNSLALLFEYFVQHGIISF